MATMAALSCLPFWRLSLARFQVSWERYSSSCSSARTGFAMPSSSGRIRKPLPARFELPVAMAALGASATAISVSRVLLGDAADFHVGALAYAGGATRPLYFVLGAVAGLTAIAYNRLLLGTIATIGQLDRWPVE